MKNFSRLLVRRLFLEHHGDLQTKLTRQLGCPQTAADVAQDAYLRVIEVEKPVDIQHPRAYLFQTARNLAINTQRRPPFESLDQAGCEAVDQISQFVSHATPESDCSQSQMASLIRDAMATLPPRQLEVLLLHRFRDYTQSEIAGMLGISLGTVEKHIAAAMAHCRAHLSALGIDEFP